MKEYIIDGNNFSNYREAYMEIRKVICDKNKDNLTISELIKENIPSNEQVSVTWLNSEKSKQDLGHKETAMYLKRRMQTIPMCELVQTLKEFKDMENGIGETLFDKTIDAFAINGLDVQLK